MSLAHTLVVAHLSVTAVLTLVFVVVVGAQRLTGALSRRRTTPLAYPSEADRSASRAPVPAQPGAVSSGAGRQLSHSS